MEGQAPRRFRTKQTARKTTGLSKPPKKVRAEAAKKQAAAAIVEDMPKKKRAAPKGLELSQVDSNKTSFRAEAGPSQQTRSESGPTAPSQGSHVLEEIPSTSLMVEVDVCGSSGKHTGLFFLQQFCDLAQTSHDVAQSSLERLALHIQESRTEYEASRAEATQLRAENERLRQTNERLRSDNVALRRHAWGPSGSNFLQYCKYIFRHAVLEVLKTGSHDIGFEAPDPSHMTYMFYVGSLDVCYAQTVFLLFASR